MSLKNTQLEERIYRRFNSVVFKKTKETYGGLSNMASGFPLQINGLKILTSEALYQACRFPHLPDVQKAIIEQKSPMTAKMKSKPYRKDSRKDWQEVRIQVMRWCLRLKLFQNPEMFFPLLINTGSLPIVEESNKDAFWGAKPINEDSLKGINALGRLLMELRHEFERAEDGLYTLKPPTINNFLLANEPISSLTFMCNFKSIREKAKASSFPNAQEVSQLTLEDIVKKSDRY